MNIRNYLDYGIGQSNLIISAPHGGYLNSVIIPRRTSGTLVKDTSSLEIIRKMLIYFSVKPTFIIAKIHRSRVDLNREIKEAAQGNHNAELIWNTWHKFLDEHCKPGTLYIDLHSHNNSDDFQLGFDLSKEAFLELEKHPEDPNYDRVYGEYSVKNSLESYGYKVYEPKNGEVYFNGGYDIERHGKNGVNAFQIEMPVAVVRGNYETIARMLVNSIERYYFARYTQ